MISDTLLPACWPIATYGTGTAIKAIACRASCAYMIRKGNYIKIIIINTSIDVMWLLDISRVFHYSISYISTYSPWSGF